ncbi:hypothetical protein INN71_01925 [Nocardioides sp. ChNu-153]|uniref:hypothetical protein n=1 Tax=unclassified Nocardioides TaxID=2615069 RepID=UPI0024050CF8|nr:MULTISPECIES: hypothetical protein [unclassified Nocardioides]MDF9714730.1 hypothetical protein [Nocardioides sp. ChNu-99]MDN7120142.1 hypothetical protein [Nocardioides sp. ChNu-153]
MTTWPTDAQVWREREARGEDTPWSEEGVTFLADGEVPAVLDESYLTPDDLANPDIAANVAANRDTAALVTWVAQREEEAAYGYWRGPDDTPLAEAAVVLLDTEGQFGVLEGRTISEALSADHDGLRVDYEDYVAACAEAGVEIAADLDDLEQPEVAVTPRAFHQQRYDAHRAG